MNRKSADEHSRRGRSHDADTEQGRQPEVERLERDSFILLQHVYTVTGADPAAPVNGSRVGMELGFAPDESSRLIHYLHWVGFMKESASGPHLSLAPEGIEYLEHRAGRRQSVRADSDKTIPIPVFLGP